MSFDWLNYYKLAQELTGSASGISNADAKNRSAISRAYYAAFCLARNHLCDIEGHSIPFGANVHEYVRKEFGCSQDKNRKLIGTNLNRMRLDRNKADYKDSINNLPNLANNNLIMASKIISILKTL